MGSTHQTTYFDSVCSQLGKGDEGGGGGEGWDKGKGLMDFGHPVEALRAFHLIKNNTGVGCCFV